MESQGVLYIATGRKYILAAIESAKTVRNYCPELPIHFFSDWQDHGFHFDMSPFPFYTVAAIENPHRRSKVDYLSKTPYDHTLYLDTDTALNADIRGMFGLLERFDLAMTHAHRRNAVERLATWRHALPKAFPQFNSGVLLYRKNKMVIQFFDEWAGHFHNAGFRQDQTTLRELLWLSDLRIATLPPEYNVRYVKYHYFWTKAEAETKIFHLQRLHTGWFWMFLRPWLRRVLKLLRRLGFNPPTSWFHK